MELHFGRTDRQAGCNHPAVAPVVHTRVLPSAWHMTVARRSLAHCKLAAVSNYFGKAAERGRRAEDWDWYCKSNRRGQARFALATADYRQTAAEAKTETETEAEAEAEAKAGIGSAAEIDFAAEIAAVDYRRWIGVAMTPNTQPQRLNCSSIVRAAADIAEALESQ